LAQAVWPHIDAALLHTTLSLVIELIAAASIELVAAVYSTVSPSWAS